MGSKLIKSSVSIASQNTTDRRFLEAYLSHRLPPLRYLPLLQPPLDSGMDWTSAKAS